MHLISIHNHYKMSLIKSFQKHYTEPYLNLSKLPFTQLLTKTLKATFCESTYAATTRPAVTCRPQERSAHFHAEVTAPHFHMSTVLLRRSAGDFFHQPRHSTSLQTGQKDSLFHRILNPATVLIW